MRKQHKSRRDNRKSPNAVTGKRQRGNRENAARQRKNRGSRCGEKPRRLPFALLYFFTRANLFRFYSHEFTSLHFLPARMYFVFRFVCANLLCCVCSLYPDEFFLYGQSSLPRFYFFFCCLAALSASFSALRSAASFLSAAAAASMAASLRAFASSYKASISSKRS